MPVRSGAHHVGSLALATARPHQTAGVADGGLRSQRCGTPSGVLLLRVD